MTPSPDLKARVLADVAQLPAPARPAFRRRTAKLWLAAAVGVVLVFVAIGGLRAVERPLGFVLATAAGWGAIAGVATLASSRRSSMVGRPAPVLVLAIVATPLALGLSYWAYRQQLEVSPPMAPLGRAVACLGVSLVFAAGPFAVLAWRSRNLGVAHPRVTAAAMGVVASAWASVLMDLHCETTDLRHVALGHVAPLLVLSLVGFLIGDRLLGVNAEPRMAARVSSR
jgi:hypothetical protein